MIHLLETNHRNTIPIYNLAENYRRSGLATGENPAPDALADLLAAKARMYVSEQLLYCKKQDSSLLLFANRE